MSYQVLARKWRPQTFADTVGQQHVRQALGNALDSGRLHHAYLFAGTRGVGKTTLARIFAKALNCERGVSATPCGVCSACTEIDDGRFVDLIEVDAASRTRVDDTRELLDNVQYSPARGRFKVYLIDEVHMLSTHSFNALLKTLEEPPEHVKFLLATTDPQKLPVTVLSRCLQFNLKRIDPAEISERMAKILDAESVPYDAGALTLLASAAAGSLRDGLSLLDQAIAFGGGEVREEPTRAILGTVDLNSMNDVFSALAENDGQAVFAAIQKLDEQGPDYGRLLADIASTVQRAAVYQVCGTTGGADSDTELVARVADGFAAEDLQLAYQILINGQRDLNFAPHPRAGFEMTLLRWLAFRPPGSVADAASDGGGSGSGSVRPAIATSTIAVRPAERQASANTGARAESPSGERRELPSEVDWYRLVPELSLSGVDRMLASNCAWQGSDGDKVMLSLDSRSASQYTEARRKNIEVALTKHFESAVRLEIESSVAGETPAQRDAQLAVDKHHAAERSLIDDPNVQSLLTLFDAEVVPDSVVVRDTTDRA
ncbi:MAG: DNA polymerase III subunit gamma/tau [Pseudomonadota bacterium]